MRYLFLLLAALMFAAPSGPARAGDRHVLGFTNAQSTSTCIGDPKTPLCAIETLADCQIWSRQEHCDLVGHWRLPDRLVPGSYEKLWRYPYEVYGPVILTERDIPKWARSQGRRSWRPGDLLVQLWWTACTPVDACVEATQMNPKRAYGEGCRATDCSRENHPRTYITRMVGERWQVVDWKYDPMPDLQRLFPNLK